MLFAATKRPKNYRTVDYIKSVFRAAITFSTRQRFADNPLSAIQGVGFALSSIVKQLDKRDYTMDTLMQVVHVGHVFLLSVLCNSSLQRYLTPTAHLALFHTLLKRVDFSHLRLFRDYEEKSLEAGVEWKLEFLRELRGHGHNALLKLSQNPQMTEFKFFVREELFSTVNVSLEVQNALTRKIIWVRQ